ncbi:MAG: hypothetical protein V7739_09045 [Motiliproteus sp.]
MSDKPKLQLVQPGEGDASPSSRSDMDVTSQIIKLRGKRLVSPKTVDRVGRQLLKDGFSEEQANHILEESWQEEDHRWAVWALLALLIFGS